MGSGGLVQLACVGPTKRVKKKKDVKKNAEICCGV